MAVPRLSAVGSGRRHPVVGGAALKYLVTSWGGARVNPALAGCMPENAAGFGDVEKIDRVYTNNEIRPIRQLFLQVNRRLRVDRR